MKKLKYLVLTDHSKHSKENSLYSLMQTLAQHENTATVNVVSRGDQRNRNFFTYLKVEPLHGLVAAKDFAYDPLGRNFTTSEEQFVLSDHDVIILRLPRPLSDDFLYFLEDIFKGKVIINSPEGIRTTSTKKYLLNFPEHCPSMKLVKTKREIREFAALFPIVLKPLKEYGGKGIVKIKDNEVITGEGDLADLETFLEKNNTYIQTEGYLAMKYLKNVNQGDKRILVVNGKIMAASLRLPPKDSWVCNVAQGGRSVKSEADADEVAMIAHISPKLKAAGVLIFGADTLVDDSGKRVLSEVNTLSIGGFPQAEKQTGRPILLETINEIAKYSLERIQEKN